MAKVVEIEKPDVLSSFRNRTTIDEVVEGQYIARLVQTTEELRAVLRLRYDVFKKELAGTPENDGIDLDEYDLRCEHLIVIDRHSGEAIGTYRLNTIETAKVAGGFYASTEFVLDDLPVDILEKSVELGRACIARDHRNSRVLFLLWKGLANYLTETEKRYLFGCCSIFTQDGDVAGRVLRQLKRDGHIHDSISLRPLKDRVCIPKDFEADDAEDFELPALVKIYLRIGAKICGEPAIDREFRTVDFFALFDVETIGKRYFKMFFQ